MKKLLFVLIVLMTLTSLAQENNKSHFGIKAGLNTANQLQPNGGGFTDFKNDLGFYVGVTSHLSITRTLGVAGELLLSKINSIYELDTTTFVLNDFDPVISSKIQESDYTQTILQVPILFQIDLLIDSVYRLDHN